MRARLPLIAVTAALVTHDLVSFSRNGIGLSPYRIDLDVYRIGSLTWLHGPGLVLFEVSPMWLLPHSGSAGELGWTWWGQALGNTYVIFGAVVLVLAARFTPRHRGQPQAPSSSYAARHPATSAMPPSR